MDEPLYRDVRSDFWRRSFEAAAEYDAYLAASPEQRAQRWIAMAAKTPPLTREQRLRLTGYRRPLRVLLMSSDWCGDCVRQGPMIKRVADAGEEVELRVADRDANPALRDELRIMGAMRIPVAVFLTEEFFEVGRSSDRTLGHYRQKAVNEMGAACPVPWAIPPAGELAGELDEWVDLFEKMLLMVRLRPTPEAT